MTDYKAERDAAVAAIERVRAINTGNNRALYGNDFEAGMAKALWLVKAALDGAPEPDVRSNTKTVTLNVHYEYGYGWNASKVKLARSRKSAEVEAGCRPHDCRVFKRVQKREGVWPAGPWLPVEGEKP